MSEGTTPLNDYRQVRLEKVRLLRSMGIDPYPSASSRTHAAGTLASEFGRLEGGRVVVAGRVMSRREHPDFVFSDLQDQSGTVQLMLGRHNMRPTDPPRGSLGFTDARRLVDIGDIVQAEGTVTKTRRGEVSVDVEALRILAKSLRPLPDKWNKIVDEEVLARRRYLDMIMSPQKRERFRMVSEIQAGVRNFMRDHGFVEFNTPVLQPVYGGGRAKPFKTYLNALSNEFYLAISHELYLKRLIVAGFERVYTIGRYFRNEGMDRTHNPEFSMLETMTAFENYEFNMDLTERLYKFLASDVLGKDTFSSRGQTIALAGEWRRVSMVELVKSELGLDFLRLRNVDSANDALSQYGLPAEATVGHALVSLFEERVAATLIQPTIVYGHPVEVSPLAKATEADPRFAERFELYINGTEQGDNWSELNDPVELLRRLSEEQERRRAFGDDEAHPIDEDFVEALEYGMPPTTGVGPGIERLAMLLTEADSISDVSFFPLLRPKDAATRADKQ